VSVLQYGATHMTVWGVLTAAKRLWIVVLIGLIGGGALVWTVSQVEPAYSARVDVLFLAPEPKAGSLGPNALQTADESLVATAGVIARRMQDDESSRSQLSSNSVTLLSEGITHGHTVTLPNAGGQWTYNFQRPELDVQVTGPSSAEVSKTLAQILSRIDSELASLQTGMGVRANELIRTDRIPQILDVREATGSRARAAAIAAVLAAGLTIAAVVLLDRRLGRTRPVQQVAVLVSSSA
jgi:uncharacterized protein YdeI (BOF family)